MNKKLIKYTGGCFCGEVEYSVNLDELPRVFNCHCIDCRKKMGGVNTIIEVRDGALDICLLYTSPSPRDATLSGMPACG